MKTFQVPEGPELQLISIKGKDYLTVAYRLVWFRDSHPDWSIETELVLHDPKFTLAKATIKNKEGRIMATAHKFEDVQGFPDHMEKAETSAIGRALALCGYGTQFCADDLDEGTRLADSPIQKTNPLQIHAKSFQPEATDGVTPIQDHTPIINHGRFVGWSVGPLCHYYGGAFMANYIDEMVKSAAKKKILLTDQQNEVIKIIEGYNK